MGCIARLGCLVLLAILAIAAWFTRDRWMSKVTGSTPAVASAPLWQPLTPAAGARGQRAIESLQSSNGPVFANLQAGEIASYVFQTVGHTIPSTADSAEAAVIGDALYVRAVVSMKDIAGSGVLGPFASMVNARERLSFAGSFRVVQPGLSEFRIREIKIRDFNVPSGAIPKLVQQLRRGPQPDGLASDALPVPTPRSLADVRIANHVVTLYKTTSPAP